MINRLKYLPLTGLMVIISAQANATDQDVKTLNTKVDHKVELITQTGILPTTSEIEVLTGDIVDNEVETTALTVTQATEKYQLVPALQRYIEIKEAARIVIVAEGSGGGGGNEPD